MGLTRIAVRCPPVLDASSVGEHIAELRTALTRAAFELDGSAITRIDGAGAQLLHCVVATARARGITVTWTGASAALVAAARTLGLADLMGLPVASLAAT